MIIKPVKLLKSEYNVLDLFCGAGGLSYGFQLAGFKIFGGIDMNKDSVATHQMNFKESDFHFCGDISRIEDDKVLKFAAKIDVVIGGPPCQGFSSANRHGHHKDDPRNKLFFEFLRFVRLIRPRAFVIENVYGIITKNDGFARDRIIEITKELGYNISYGLFNAHDFGVPQTRRRAIFVATRKDFVVPFDVAKILPIRERFTVYDAISDLCYPNKTIQNEFLSYARDIENREELRNNEESRHASTIIERIKCVPQGGNWRDVPPSLWVTQRENRHSSAYKRLSFSEPSITIDTGHMNYFHPIKNRVPTVRESARLQSFPDSFVFMGTRVSQYRQVGNAVPPLLSYAVARELLEFFLSYERKDGKE